MKFLQKYQDDSMVECRPQSSSLDTVLVDSNNLILADKLIDGVMTPLSVIYRTTIRVVNTALLRAKLSHLGSGLLLRSTHIADPICCTC